MRQEHKTGQGIKSTVQQQSRDHDAMKGSLYDIAPKPSPVINTDNLEMHHPAQGASNEERPTNSMTQEYLVHSSNLPNGQAGTHLQRQPEKKLPISESTNPDAIAVRAALGILQLQRQQALRDMQTLESQKAQALSDPTSFIQSLQAGEIATSKDEVINANNASVRPENEMFPTAQTIVRTPPVNWAQYHILSAPLEDTARRERALPSGNRPRTDSDLEKERNGEAAEIVEQTRSRPATIAARYDPWRDQLEGKGKQDEDVHDAKRVKT